MDKILQSSAVTKTVLGGLTNVYSRYNSVIQLSPTSPSLFNQHSTLHLNTHL